MHYSKVQGFSLRLSISGKLLCVLCSVYRRYLIEFFFFFMALTKFIINFSLNFLLVYFLWATIEEKNNFREILCSMLHSKDNNGLRWREEWLLRLDRLFLSCQTKHRWLRFSQETFLLVLPLYILIYYLRSFLMTTFLYCNHEMHYKICLRPKSFYIEKENFS